MRYLRVWVVWILTAAAAHAGEPAPPYIEPVPVDNSVPVFRQFLARDPEFVKKAQERGAKIKSLYTATAELASQKNPSTGKPLYTLDCPDQILDELMWRVGATDDFRELDRRISDYDHAIQRVALSIVPGQKPAISDTQSPADGAWGVCYRPWFFKLTTTIDSLEQELNAGQTPKYPLVFLNTVNTPKKLIAYLKSILVSDIAKTGVDNRRELNESFSTLIRLVLRDEPSGAFKTGSKEAILKFLSEWQSPDSGYWGPRFVTSDGRTVQFDDLSITFHNLSYVTGAIPHWDKIIATTIGNLEKESPLGPLNNGQPNNHMNMDVARMFRMGWNHATDSQRATIRSAMATDLEWCLSHSLQQDGSFAPSAIDPDVPDQMYFGVAFLNEAGFLSKDSLMIPTTDFSRVDSIRSQIAAHIETLRSANGSLNPYLQNALNLVRSPKPAATATAK